MLQLFSDWSREDKQDPPEPMRLYSGIFFLNSWEKKISNVGVVGRMNVSQELLAAIVLFMTTSK